jgi:hypothetical protein
MKVSLALIVLLLFLLAAGVLIDRPIHAHAQSAARWEYAELLVTDRPNTARAVELELPNVIHSGTSWADITKKLGRATPKSNSSTEVINLLGAQGWELVGHYAVYDGMAGMYQVAWTFKKRK